MVSDPHRAEDLVQETLLAALQSHHLFTADASERTWLTAILRNKIVDQRRRNQRYDDFLADQDPAVEGNFNRLGKWRAPPKNWAPDPHALLESQEFWLVFHSCMRAIPERIREPFALRILQNHSADEVCRILGISDANLWTLLYRARERLRRCLEFKWFSKTRSES
jgi:RNA polymerase sigma-70 factor (ECF subfamily)